MVRKMLVQSSFYWIFYYVGTILFSANKAHAIAAYCQVYPSEYAYKADSVTKQESVSANCRRYPSIDGLPQGIYSTDYIHCDGAQLTLADKDLGSEQSFSSSSYYQWPTRSAAQLLFIFLTRVSLTNITLHYYSDSVRGLPRLRFYAVPDDFDVWDAPTTSYPHGPISPVRELPGRKSISSNVKFSTMKVLLYKYSSNTFAVSEVEFFTCTRAISTASILTTTNDLTTSETTQSSNMITESNIMENEIISTSSNMMIITSFKADGRNKGTAPPNNTTTITAIGVSIVLLLILSTILIIIVIVLIWSYKRRSAKQKLYTDCSYSTLSRAQTRTRSTQENSSELYDQIHLSPSTGQTEYIPKRENADINNPKAFTTPQNSHPIYSTAGEDIAENSSTLNAISQETTLQLSLQTAHESTSEQPTYAAVDISKKKRLEAGEKGLPRASAQEKKESVTKEDIHSPHMIEQLYKAVKKKEKVGEPKDEEETPPIPPYTVEELYAAVQKKPKGRSNTDGNKVDHKIPPRLEEETYVAGEITLQNTAEHPYTAVTKPPKDSSTENTETAPPIPPHTVEELYTAVMKTPKSATEDEDKAPPKPPCTVEKN